MAWIMSLSLLLSLLLLAVVACNARCKCTRPRRNMPASAVYVMRAPIFSSNAYIRGEPSRLGGKAARAASYSEMARSRAERAHKNARHARTRGSSPRRARAVSVSDDKRSDAMAPPSPTSDLGDNNARASVAVCIVRSSNARARRRRSAWAVVSLAAVEPAAGVARSKPAMSTSSVA